jgi:predicted ATP-grasp superfamily ATP-dependent carboligase
VIARQRQTLPLACVIGPIEVERALGLAGIRCAVVARPNSPTRYSRYTKRVVEWVDPWKQPEVLVARLTDFGRAQREKPVLYYSHDWDLLVVSRFRDRLRQAFRFVVPDPTLVEDLVDKARFQALAERLELPVPRGQALSPVNGAQPADVNLRFPLVVKPLTRQHETWRPISSAKAMAIRSPKELHGLWPRLAELRIDVLLQEIVEGPESLIESYHAYVDETGHVGGEFTGKKIRTHPPEFGYSTAVVITNSAEVTALGRALSERLGIRGVSKFDFKRGADGELHLLEINPRFNLWHHPGARAGVNLPALVYADLVGLPRAREVSARPGVRWCSLRHDAQAARAEGVRFTSWFRWMLTVELKSPFAWTDPLPFVLASLQRARRPRRIAMQLMGRRAKRPRRGVPPR